MTPPSFGSTPDSISSDCESADEVISLSSSPATVSEDFFCESPPRREVTAFIAPLTPAEMLNTLKLHYTRHCQAKPEERMSFLFYVARHGTRAHLEALINTTKVDFKEVSYTGFGVLHEVIMADQLDIMLYLFEHREEYGIDFTAKTITNLNLLGYALTAPIAKGRLSKMATWIASTFPETIIEAHPTTGQTAFSYLHHERDKEALWKVARQCLSYEQLLHFARECPEHLPARLKGNVPSL